MTIVLEPARTKTSSVDRLPAVVMDQAAVKNRYSLVSVNCDGVHVYVFVDSVTSENVVAAVDVSPRTAEVISVGLAPVGSVLRQTRICKRPACVPAAAEEINFHVNVHAALANVPVKAFSVRKALPPRSTPGPVAAGRTVVPNVDASRVVPGSNHE